MNNAAHNMTLAGKDNRDTRLIERWLPIAALSEESVRERRSMTALPPIYYLHVWWARRPLVASRAAILASVLPAGVDHKKFLHALGIHGDPVAAKRKMDNARRTGIRVENPYDYARAFSYNPDSSDRQWVREALGNKQIVVLDPTAGGGSIPFEAMRLGFSTLANDLNPVAATILRGTLQWPMEMGQRAADEYWRLAKTFLSRIQARLQPFFPQKGAPDCVDLTYLWARTIHCPYCEGLVPLSPNWRLASDGKGIRLVPHLSEGPGRTGRICSFELVQSVKEQSAGTVADGDGTCPFTDCARVIPGDEIKRQAQAGSMGEQLYAVVVQRRVETKTKSGKRGRDKWERGYRTPRPEDSIADEIGRKLDEKMPEWEALDRIPTEAIPVGVKTAEPLRYGMRKWQDVFSPRQLLVHCTGVEIFHELLEEEKACGAVSPQAVAALVYLSFTLDKMLNYNSRMSIWMPTREVVANTFNRHDFAFCWSYAEMAPNVEGCPSSDKLLQVRSIWKRGSCASAG